MQLEQQTPLLGLERAVINPGRPAGICGRVELDSAIALRVVPYDQVALGHEPEGTRRQKAAQVGRLRMSAGKLVSVLSGLPPLSR